MKLPLVIMYVPIDMVQDMCNQVILENGAMSNFIHDC